MVEFNHYINEKDSIVMPNYVPTTYVGGDEFQVQEQTGFVFLFSGCNILINSGCLLTKKSYELKVSFYLSPHI